MFAGDAEPAAQTKTPAPAGTPAKVSLMDSPTDPDRFSNLPHLFVDDVVHVASAPARWDRSDWVTAGVTAALVVGTGALLDQSIDTFVVKHANASSDRFAKAVQNLGGAPSVAIAGGTYLAGIAFKDPEVRATGIDLMASMGIAQLLVVIPTKIVVGRSRPDAEQGAHDFHPFNGGQSFPSGHTTQAFALASVISAHADQTWVSCVSYGLAGMVGLARMEQRKHFLSDVVTGGIVGTLVGKSVVSFNESRRTDARSKLSLTFAPLVLPGGYGISVGMKF
jgi:membrane-associated phospholipid phosphatase